MMCSKKQLGKRLSRGLVSQRNMELFWFWR